MRSLSEQLQQMRSQTELCLYSGERQVEVWAGVMAMANLPLPPGSKYHHINAETLVMENSAGANRKEVRPGSVASVCHDPSVGHWNGRGLKSGNSAKSFTDLSLEAHFTTFRVSATVIRIKSNP